MKKINFIKHILPHITAIAVFVIVTVSFFNPAYFKHQKLNQHDSQQWEGSSKQIRDFREKTGEEALWTNAMFSGMPAYLINVLWSNQIVSSMKRVLTVWLPYSPSNILLAFVCYYIMLLAFRIRPYLAIGGAIAFGLSSYMIIGLGAGHNARIGAIAIMPLAMAGIHLIFSGRQILGFAVSAVGLALELRENHLQVTYYFGLIVIAYGLVQLILAVQEKKIVDFFKNTAILILASLLAVGTFFGQLWGVMEYSAFSTRGKSELVSVQKTNNTGLSKEYAFSSSNGILEPLTLIVPNFYGGSTSNYLVSDQKSNVYKALVNSGDQKTANQLANYTQSYWGPQSLTAPYYASAIICFLFVVGILFAEKRYVWWLIPISIISILFTWGDNFKAFNYFVFDYFPGYNKFRSVTFSLVIVLFAMPLLGMLGIEKIMVNPLDKLGKKKILIALSFTGGLCFLLLLFAGAMSFMRDEESQLPSWFLNAIIDDRKSMFRSDAFRSLIFIVLVFLAIYFEIWKRINANIFFIFLTLIIIIDLVVVDKRYFTAANYQKRNDSGAMAITEADQEILKDPSYYRVYNIQGTMNEAHTSYFHNSIGGYHGAKMRRYQDLYDSCLFKQTNSMIDDVQIGKLDFKKFGALNMLNIKYIVYGPNRDNIIPNAEANGSAWFVQNIVKVKSANEELNNTCGVNTKQTAVIDESKFEVPDVTFDSASSIKIIEHKPNYLKYESESNSNSLAVFSEIYYPKGWQATIDGKDVPILRADYVLRALQVPAGKHSIEFRFKPKAYFVGNKVILASSWILLITLLGSLGVTLKKQGVF